MSGAEDWIRGGIRPSPHTSTSSVSAVRPPSRRIDIPAREMRRLSRTADVGAEMSRLSGSSHCDSGGQNPGAALAARRTATVTQRVPNSLVIHLYIAGLRLRAESGGSRHLARFAAVASRRPGLPATVRIEACSAGSPSANEPIATMLIETRTTSGSRCATGPPALAAYRTTHRTPCPPDRYGALRRRPERERRGLSGAPIRAGRNTRPRPLARTPDGTDAASGHRR